VVESVVTTIGWIGLGKTGNPSKKARTRMSNGDCEKVDEQGVAGVFSRTVDELHGYLRTLMEVEQQAKERVIMARVAVTSLSSMIAAVRVEELNAVWDQAGKRVRSGDAQAALEGLVDYVGEQVGELVED